MPGIIQNVTVQGSTNEVVVAGHDVHYEVVYQLPEASVEDRRNLRSLLALVRQQWVVSVLEQAVRETALLELGMHSEPRMVLERPWTREREAVGSHPEVLPPGTGIDRVFDDSGRTLLILGEAGAGKTITLLTLGRGWADRAERDPFAPVPVVFNLSSWAASRKSIHDWIVHELAQHYGTGESLAVRWLKERRLLLLLDGLDEVAVDRRAACVEAIHDFVDAHGVPGLAVCCRRDEYRAIPVRLRLGGAVTLLPLTPEQVDSYVRAGGDRLSGVRSALGASAGLRGLAESPLMLNILSVAFADVPAGELGFDEAVTGDALRDAIFARYVHRMFGLREHAGGEFSRERTCGWLRWLANGMMRRGESIFAIELLQPAWLTRRQLLLYALASRVAGATMTATVIGAAVCLGLYALLLVADSSTRDSLSTTSAATVGRVVTTFAVAAASIGVAAGLFYLAFDYHRLTGAIGERWRRHALLEMLFFTGYILLAFLAVLSVGGIAFFAFGPELDDPHLWAADITVLVSVPSLPLFFGRKPGRGDANADISLVGTLTWRWRSAAEFLFAGVALSVLCLPLAALTGVSRAGVAAMLALITFVGLAYQPWQHEVPPVQRWTGGRVASSLLNSSRVFALVSAAWVAVAFPALLLFMGPWESAATPLLAAVLMAIVLFSPALFWFGGLDWVLHATLRLVLSGAGTMPLRLRRFLDYAVHLGFLRRAGGGYIFFHRLLLEHFAARPPSTIRGPVDASSG
jgi:hypothetical protein